MHTCMLSVCFVCVLVCVLVCMPQHKLEKLKKYCIVPTKLDDDDAVAYDDDDDDFSLVFC